MKVCDCTLVSRGLRKHSNTRKLLMQIHDFVRMLPEFGNIDEIQIERLALSLKLTGARIAGFSDSASHKGVERLIAEIL